MIDNSTDGNGNYAHIFWSLLLSGCRKSEYLREWEVYNDRIKIYSSKEKQSQQSSRLIPFIRHNIPFLYTPEDVGYAHKSDLSFEYKCIYDPGTKFTTFVKALRKITCGEYSPHDFRHTFRMWLQLAGIPSERIEYYLGHKLNAKDSKAVYSRYGDNNIIEFLEIDAATIEKWLHQQEEEYQANFNAHSGDFLGLSAKMYDDGPVLVFKKNIAEKRKPRKVTPAKKAEIKS